MLTAACCVALLNATPIFAAYPERPIRFIVSSGAGGAPDFNARVLAAELSKQMGQQFVVDNRPGAGSTLGTTMMAKAVPDGKASHGAASLCPRGCRPRSLRA
jgi:tripartite-type tricarboxylate transporter receptor subunit TctC